MKLYLTSKTYCIPLTWAEWDILNCREKEHDILNYNKPFVFYPTTWNFPNKELIDSYEWNGHFGANVFFRVETKAGTQAEVNLMRHLQKILKPTPEYIMGLHQGASGADMVLPKKLTRLKRAIFEAAYNTGQQVGTAALENERN